MTNKLNIVKNELTACNMTQLFVIPISAEFTTRQSVVKSDGVRLSKCF